MKAHVAGMALLLAALTGCISIQGRVAVSEPGHRHDTLRHVVLLKFREGVTPAQMRYVEEQSRDLPGAIGEIDAFEWGLEESGRNLNKGFTHAMLFSFDSEADRDAYLVHPSHTAFVERMKPYVDEIFVFDYWARD